MVQSVHAYHFDLPLAHPFLVRDQQITSREGMIIHVLSEWGNMGFGEMAPLPGVSQESFGKAAHQLEILVSKLKDSRAPMEPRLLLQWFAERMPDDKVCPSVKFGMESAIINMIAAAKETTVHALLRPDRPGREAFTAGLLQGALSDIKSQAKFFAVKGYRTFNMNVGSRNIALDVQKVEAVRKIVGAGARLRLNANRSWRLDEALLFAEGIGKQCIEYIQEPLADPIQLEEFFRRTDMPVADDETLEGRPVDEIAGHLGVSYATYRPRVTGGVSGYMHFLEDASRAGLKTVLTSTFESGIGMTMLANLAAMTDTPADLGAANWFNEDLLLRPVEVDAGRIPADRMKIDIRYFHSHLAGKLTVT